MRARRSRSRARQEVLRLLAEIPGQSIRELQRNCPTTDVQHVMGRALQQGLVVEDRSVRPHEYYLNSAAWPPAEAVEEPPRLEAPASSPMPS